MSETTATSSSMNASVDGTRYWEAALSGDNVSWIGDFRQSPAYSVQLGISVNTRERSYMSLRLTTSSPNRDVRHSNRFKFQREIRFYRHAHHSIRSPELEAENLQSHSNFLMSFAPMTGIHELSIIESDGDCLSSTLSSVAGFNESVAKLVESDEEHTAKKDLLQISLHIRHGLDISYDRVGTMLDFSNLDENSAQAHSLFTRWAYSCDNESDQCDTTLSGTGTCTFRLVLRARMFEFKKWVSELSRQFLREGIDGRLHQLFLQEPAWRPVDGAPTGSLIVRKPLPSIDLVVSSHHDFTDLSTLAAEHAIGLEQIHAYKAKAAEELRKIEMRAWIFSLKDLRPNWYLMLVSCPCTNGTALGEYDAIRFRFSDMHGSGFPFKGTIYPSTGLQSPLSAAKFFVPESLRSLISKENISDLSRNDWNALLTKPNLDQARSRSIRINLTLSKVHTDKCIEALQHLTKLEGQHALNVERVLLNNDSRPQFGIDLLHDVPQSVIDQLQQQSSHTSKEIIDYLRNLPEGLGLILGSEYCDETEVLSEVIIVRLRANPRSTTGVFVSSNAAANKIALCLYNESRKHEETSSCCILRAYNHKTEERFWRHLVRLYQEALRKGEDKISLHGREIVVGSFIKQQWQDTPTHARLTQSDDEKIEFDEIVFGNDIVTDSLEESSSVLQVFGLSLTAGTLLFAGVIGNATHSNQRWSRFRELFAKLVVSGLDGWEDEDLKHLRFDAQREVLQNAQILITTPSRSTANIIRFNYRPELVVVDDANTMPVAEFAIPLSLWQCQSSLKQKFLFAGKDPRSSHQSTRLGGPKEDSGFTAVSRMSILEHKLLGCWPSISLGSFSGIGSCLDMGIYPSRKRRHSELEV